MNAIKIKPIFLAVVLTNQAWAAENIESKNEAVNIVEEVVVTGFRGSLENSLNAKRDSAGAVDAVFAEDIADFPDSNLAESLQRIPGISITREAGEGRQISVRGLGPDFTRIRINGMEAIATTGGTDAAGSTNRGRGFDFNMFAAELFNSLVVRKTASADLDEGSLGAVVDLNTAKPLDLANDFNVAASAKAAYNDLSGEVSPRFTGLIGGKNSDNTFGYALSLAISERDTLETGTSTVRWRDEKDFGSCSGCADQGAFDLVNDAHYPRIPRIDKFTHTQERIGLTGSLQFAPNDDTSFSLDYLKSNTESTRQEEFLELGIKESINAPNADVTDYNLTTINLNGESVRHVLTSMTLDNVRPRIENRLDEMETDFSQLSLSASHSLTDQLRINALMGTSKSKYENPIQTTIILDAKAQGVDSDGNDTYINDYSYDYGHIAGRVPTIDYGTLDVSDPSHWQFTQIRQRPNVVENSFDTLNLDLEYDINDSISVKGGLSMKEYTFKADEQRLDKNNVADAIVNGAAIGSVLDVTNEMVYLTTADGVELGAGSDLTWVSPNVYSSAALVDLYNQPLSDKKLVHQKVVEDNLGFYVQMGWNTDIAGMAFRGDLGVRRVTTDLTSEGVADVPDGAGDFKRENIVVARSYSKTLPSINMALEPTDEVVLRLSAAKAITRPTLGSLTPGGTVDTFNAKVTYQNPYLDPFEANTFDLAIEYYFAEESLVSLAYFRKDIASFISNSTQYMPYQDTGLPHSYLDGTNYGPTDIFEVKRKANGEGGDANGFEIIYQQHFGMLPGLLANTGVQTNLTFIDSEMNYGTSDDPNIAPMNNQSEKTYSLTGYYEDEVFSTRLSIVSRNDYLTKAQGDGYIDSRGVKGSTHVDTTFSYQVTDQIKVTVDGNNLTNEYFDRYNDSTDLTSVYHRTGRQYALGISYKM